MLDEMVREDKPARLQRGVRSASDGMWLEGPSDEQSDSDKTNARKICAMGVRCSRWVTMHGIALNVSNELSFFNHIIPCGIEDKSVTNLSNEAKKALPLFISVNSCTKLCK